MPNTPWTGTHLWDFEPRRFTILTFGLFIFGLGDALIISAGLGNAPWSVLAQGIAKQLGITIGMATLTVSFLVLLLWIPLKEKPGLGTVMNMLVIALAIDFGLWLFPSESNVLLEVAMVILGTFLVGAGSSLYITCGLGTGPRDGLMTGLHYKTGVRVGRVRLGIEIIALSVGALLGGSLGVGTALFALLIGQSVAISLGVVER
ncbi:MAG: hypothetical protein RLZZ99_1033, partial [Actinomycetota bacterium]